MNRAEIQMFLTSLATVFLRDDSKGIDQYFNLPVPYYVPGHLFVFSNASHLAERFDAYRTFLRERGVVNVRPANIVIVDASRDRALVETEWEYLCGSGRSKSTSRIRYVLRRGRVAGDLRIELVDYTVVAFPQFLEQTSSLPPR